MGAITAVDAHTDRSYPPGTVVLFGGLLSAPGAVVDDMLRFATFYVRQPFTQLPPLDAARLQKVAREMATT